MKQHDLAKIRWNVTTIDLYTQVMKEEVPPNITKQQLRTIVKNINAYKLELDDDNTSGAEGAIKMNSLDLKCQNDIQTLKHGLKFTYSLKVLKLKNGVR